VHSAWSGMCHEMATNPVHFGLKHTPLRTVRLFAPPR